MSLLPAFVISRLRNDSSAHPAEPEFDSQSTQNDDDNIFSLLPPGEQQAEAAAPKPLGTPRHPVDMTDLSRLSIDREGRLYWDGKAVETHHRVAMTRRQSIGATVVAIFVIIGAIGAALQGAAAVRDWACRLGLSSGACMSAPARSTAEIPA
jgi:hypothetical protein